MSIREVHLLLAGGGPTAWAYIGYDYGKIVGTWFGARSQSWELSGEIGAMPCSITLPVHDRCEFQFGRHSRGQRPSGPS